MYTKMEGALELRMSDLINVILVNADVRPAMLIQPADYKESTGAYPRTSAVLTAIKEKFPDLVHSEEYAGVYQGIIISKVSYDGETLSQDDMGRVLGYPCYEGFETLDRDKETFTNSIMVSFSNELSPTSIIANVCRDNSKLPEFEDIARRASAVLKSDDIVGGMVHEVFVESNMIVPVQKLISKLTKFLPLSSSEKNEMWNILYNIGFEEEVQTAFIREFKFDNRTHIGILLGLLIFHENDVMSPFFPIQGHGADIALEVSVIQDAWARQIIDTLTNT